MPSYHKKAEVRWLGYYITQDWKWTHQIQTWINKAAKTGRAIGALTARYQKGGLNAWSTQRLIKGLILPQLTYGVAVWANKGKLKEAAKSLHTIIRRAFSLQTKTPSLAIETEIGISPHNLYV